MAKKNYSKGEKEHVSQLIEYVLERDEASVILKSHLFLEQTLEKTINCFAENPEFILRENFRIKTIFLYSIGVIDKTFLDRLLFVNTIRNKFSHEYGYKISKEDMNKISKLSSMQITIPSNLITFYRAKEAIMFIAAVSRLEQVLGILIKLNKPLSRKIFMEVIKSVYNKKKIVDHTEGLPTAKKGK